MSLQDELDSALGTALGAAVSMPRSGGAPRTSVVPGALAETIRGMTDSRFGGAPYRPTTATFDTTQTAVYYATIGALRERIEKSTDHKTRIAFLILRENLGWQ